MPRLITLDHQPKTRRKRVERAEVLRREAAGERWVPGPAGLRILELLLRYRYLTRELLELAYGGASDGGAVLPAKLPRGRGGAAGPGAVKNHLRRLWNAWYIERFYRPSESGYGSQQFVYTIRDRGVRVLVDARRVKPEVLNHERSTIHNRLRRRRDYEHLLAESLVQVLWDLGAPAFGHVFKTVAYWRDREGEERRSPTNRFPVTVAGKRGYVDPDATVLVALKKFYRPIFVEVERTHKNKARLVRRFKAYEALLTSQERSVTGVFEKALGIVPEPATVLFIAANERHRDELWKLASEVLRPYSASHPLEMWFLALTDLFDRRIEGNVGTKEDKETETILQPAEFFQRRHAVRHATAEEMRRYQEAAKEIDPLVRARQRREAQRWGQVIPVTSRAM